ncbi:MAG: hypothetical protein WCE80_10445 [Acidimicrobiia bacterium]
MELTLGRFVVEAAVEFGPRVTGMRVQGGENFLAVLSPDVVVGEPDDPYRLMGGHRVWASPEVPNITYAPDGHECSVSSEGESLTIRAGEDRVGIVKEISVTRRGKRLEVVNRLQLTRPLGTSFAAWAITQFPQGGTAIIPLAGDETAPLPNRRLVLWPYTSLVDPRVTVRSDVVLMDASGDDQIKLGTGPSPGRLGYWRDGWLFMKTVEDATGHEVPDMGANGQVYVGNGFCELESVGGAVAATEGAVATVSEVWSLLECPDLDSAVAWTTGSPTT